MIFVHKLFRLLNPPVTVDPSGKRLDGIVDPIRLAFAEARDLAVELDAPFVQDLFHYRTDALDPFQIVDRVRR